MTLFRNLSIRTKLLVVLLAVSLIIPSLFVLYFQSRFVENSRIQLTREAEHTARILSHAVSTAMAINDTSSVDRLLQGSIYNPDISYIQVYADNGQLYSQYMHNEIIDTAHLSESIAGKKNIIKYATPIYDPNGKKLGLLILGINTSSMIEQVRQNLLTLGIGIVVVFLLTVFIVFFVSGYLVKPLKILASAAQKIGAGDLSMEIKGAADDEIGYLGSVFNKMRLHLIESKKEIQGYTGRLEVLVDQRTGELKKRNQELLEQTKRAHEASRLKSEFLANMSHEIRTPMNGIMGMADILLDSPLNGDQKEIARIINSSAVSLLRILNDILDISKIEVGKLEIVKQEFNLHDLLQDVSAFFKADFDTKGISLKLSFADQLPRMFISDMPRIKQVLINLVSNAIKFTEQGQINIDVFAESIHDSNFNVTFKVRDTGIGIPENKLQSIFESFTQVDGSKTRKIGGTGLGLAISSQIIRLLSGEIAVKSEVGKYSEFWFTVPLQAYTVPDDHNKNNNDRSYKEEIREIRVLIAEDNPINQKLIKRLVQKIGYAHYLVENGKKALDALKAERYDLVLMDIQMPEMDGLEATRMIRRQTALQDIPIIAVTANAMEGDREICINAGMNDYLSKPIKLADLKNKMQSWLADN